MSERTKFHPLIPWTGGLNTATDPAFTNEQDLVVAENIQFAATGVREKREGFEYFDLDLLAMTHRTSSATTRTLTIPNLQTGSNQYLVNGEKVTITSTNTAYATTAATITAITASTFSYTGTGSLTEGPIAETSFTITRATQYLNITDYWRTDNSDVKQQLIMAVNTQGKVFKHDQDGRRLEVTGTGSPAATVAHVNTVIFGDRYIACFDPVGSKPIKYDPDIDSSYFPLGSNSGTWATLGAQYGASTTQVPDASFMVSWQGRLWANDKTDPDRLFASAINDPETWGGYGDSGAIPIGVPGEGDTDGIVAAWPFKDMLLVRKGRKTYRIIGDYSLETYVVEEVSGSIGGVAQAAQANMGDADFVWVSKKGIHAGSVTEQYGDITSQYVSAKIQPTFNALALQLSANFQAAHLEILNSVFFAVTEGSAATNDTLYVYNYVSKEWYVWPDMDCISIQDAVISGKKRLLVGTSNARIKKSHNDSFTDFTSTPIYYRIKTPVIYPGKDLTSLKAFYRLRLYYKPVNRLVIQATIKIDGRSINSPPFQHLVEGDLLGDTFILGASVLGATGIFAPYSIPLSGIGRGIEIELLVSGTDEQISIYGLDIEYEPMDQSPEVAD